MRRTSYVLARYMLCPGPVYVLDISWPGGGIGRRSGLKIRLGSRPVGVRVPSGLHRQRPSCAIYGTEGRFWFCVEVRDDGDVHAETFMPETFMTERVAFDRGRPVGTAVQASLAGNKPCDADGQPCRDRVHVDAFKLLAVVIERTDLNGGKVEAPVQRPTVCEVVFDASSHSKPAGGKRVAEFVSCDETSQRQLAVRHPLLAGPEVDLAADVEGTNYILGRVHNLRKLAFRVERADIKLRKKAECVGDAVAKSTRKRESGIRAVKIVKSEGPAR